MRKESTLSVAIPYLHTQQRIFMSCNVFVHIMEESLQNKMNLIIPRILISLNSDSYYISSIFYLDIELLIVIAW